MATITRRLDSVLNDMEDILLYSKEDFNYAISEASNADKDTISDKTANLYNMFIKAGVNECEKNQSVDYYQKLYEDRIETNDDYNRNVEERVLRVLYDRFEMFPSPEDYMKRIVDNNSFKEDEKWKTDSVRLRILKQFIKYTDYLRLVDHEYNASKIGIQRYIARKLGIERYRDVKVDDVIENIDDSIFGFIGSNEWNGRDKLLSTADNLAKGKFRTSGRTTLEVYYFAMAYNMTYYSGAKGTVYQAKTDIEKNLFRDFYHNNLVRIASDEYQNNPRAYEAVPTGRGINYKNYSEMVYLYYINMDISSLDKVIKSAEMISRLQESAEEKNRENKGEKLTNAKLNTTEYYRNHFKLDDELMEVCCEDIINSNEDEFYKFIDNNYDCRRINANPVSKEKDQNTAYAVYCDIIKRIKKNNDGIVEKDAVGFVDSELDLGRLWIVDFKLFNGALDNIKKDIQGVEQERFDKFVLIVRKAIDLIDNKKFWLKESADKMTRTAVVVAYYYYFCLEYINEISGENVTFRDIYNLVSLDLNQALERCGYQTLNGRDIFDVIVLMSIYVYAKI